jgi:hypothetical protein
LLSLSATALGVGVSGRRYPALLEHRSPEITGQWRSELRNRLRRRFRTREIGVIASHLGQRVGRLGVGVVELRAAYEMERSDAQRVPERREYERSRKRTRYNQC